jgi:hypothetical protein
MMTPRPHRPLAVTAVAMAALTLVAVAGMLLDDRTLLGVPIWLKPFKFAISLVIYTATLAWLVALVPGRPGRHAGWLGNVIAAAAVAEMVVIVGQVIRGRRSHFNVATAFDSTLWTVMAVSIVMLWIATALIGILLLRHHRGERPTTVAVRLGLLVALGGMAIGFLMTSPTAEQLAAMSDGPPAVVGAHSVGVPDGGPGMLLVNWSTTGGDLRIGHFIGLHALQALPLLALALAYAARRVARLRPEAVRVRLVVVGAAAFAGLTALTTWQALRGQPLVHPDALTIAAAALLAAGTVAGALAALRPPRRNRILIADGMSTA